jgi:nucleotide-binding universal stress UspA family protein
MQDMIKKGTGYGLKSLIAVDDTEHSKRAVDVACNFLNVTGARITLLTVLEDVLSYDEIPETYAYSEKTKIAKELLGDMKEICQKRGVADAETRITVGPIADEIIRIAKEEGFSYIIIGTKRKGGLKKMFMGSVAEKVIYNAHCPVVVIR